MEKNYTKKFKTIKKIISIANLNSHSSCAAIIEPFLDVFETVKSFKNYFPDQNCETILQNVNKRTQINKNKDNQKKIIENKLRLAKYTFYVEEMRKHMLDQIRKRTSVNKRKKRSGRTKNSPLICLPPRKKTSIKILGGERFSEAVKKFIINSNLKKKIKCKK